MGGETSRAGFSFRRPEAGFARGCSRPAAPHAQRVTCMPVEGMVAPGNKKAPAWARAFRLSRNDRAPLLDGAASRRVGIGFDFSGEFGQAHRVRVFVGDLRV